MGLVSTNLFIQAGQLPVTFKGSPQDLFTAMIQRMKIVSPNGVNFIFIGDVEPTSNVGPWLKGGTQWWVWDDATNQYEPLDLSASFTPPYAIGNSTPSTTNPPLWLQTTQDATDLAPTAYGEPIGWMLFDGANWVPFDSIPLSGNTASRPSSPANLQQYYDTDISCLIWFERGAWRTVSGVLGDVKFVTSSTAAAALTQNPGWALYGTVNQASLGAALVGASQDPGAAPVEQLSPITGVNPQAQGATGGAGPQLLQVNPTSTLVFTPTLALWCLVKT